MFNKKTKLKLTDFECNLLWGGMNEFRNKACSDGVPAQSPAAIKASLCSLLNNFFALYIRLAFKQ